MDSSKEIPTGKRNIKLDLRTWNTLKNLKKPNETFNDVILFLLKERTVSAEKGNLKAIKYNRKTTFLQIFYKDKVLGVEFEYNDVKSEQTEFTLDLKLKKIFFGKRVMNPSEFFGVDSQHKHLNSAYLDIYLQGLAMILVKEFKILLAMVRQGQYESILHWKKVYYDHSLSEDSFINDIEEPLRLSEEEKPSAQIKESIKKSESNAIWHLI